MSRKSGQAHLTLVLARQSLSIYMLVIQSEALVYLKFGMRRGGWQGWRGNNRLYFFVSSKWGYVNSGYTEGKH